MQVTKSPSISQVPEPSAACPVATAEQFWTPVFFRESQGEFVQGQFA